MHVSTVHLADHIPQQFIRITNTQTNNTRESNKP